MRQESFAGFAAVEPATSKAYEDRIEDIESVPSSADSPPSSSDEALCEYVSAKGVNCVKDPKMGLRFCKWCVICVRSLSDELKD